MVTGGTGRHEILLPCVLGYDKDHLGGCKSTLRLLPHKAAAARATGRQSEASGSVLETERGVEPPHRAVNLHISGSKY